MINSIRTTVAVTASPKKGTTVPGLATGRRHTVVIRKPGAHLVRLAGMRFDHGKSFLLPTAMNGIRKIREIYEKSSAGSLLLVGHTDSTGRKSYNLKISLERARSVAAFLTDDVEAWMAFYQHPDHDRRWGLHEDKAMLSALPIEGNDPYLNNNTSFSEAVRRFQRENDLKDDGICGPFTRRALIKNYMNFDGTTLPSEINLYVHGCGEHFPAEDLGDNARSQLNRRVEGFMFPGEMEPAATGETSDNSDRFYPAWLAQVTETIDVTDDFPEDLRLRLCDQTGKPMADCQFLVRIGKQATVAGKSDSGGFADVAIPSICPEMLQVAWGGDSENGPFEYVRELFVDCSGGTTERQIISKLHNLGYIATEDLGIAVWHFQRDFNVDADPAPLGLVNGTVPDNTLRKLNEVFTARQGVAA